VWLAGQLHPGSQPASDRLQQLPFFFLVGGKKRKKKKLKEGGKKKKKNLTAHFSHGLKDEGLTPM
jgi:hypothetical protein